MDSTVKDIDEYIAGFPEEIQKMLQQIRATIKEVAPKAEEAIKYAIPTFMLNGKNLVHFAAFKSHIGFYPTLQALNPFRRTFQSINKEKGLCSSHSINPCRWP